MQLVAVNPLHPKPAVYYRSIYFDQIPAFAELAAWLTGGIICQFERRRPITEDLIELAQVVKTHLRLRKFFQLSGDRFVAAQVSEQTVTDASIRHAPQLLFYRLQRLSRSGRVAQVEQHREYRCEPADGPRKIRAFDDLFSPVTFKIDEHFFFFGPLGERLGQGCEQYVVDLG